MAQWRHPVTEVVSGCCRGVDRAGEEWARQRGIPVKRFPANWKKFGVAAGPIRNAEMAEYAEALVAIPTGVSRGTRDMIDKAKARGLEIDEVWFDGIRRPASRM